jgi:hypothetical protein
MEPYLENVNIYNKIYRLNSHLHLFCIYSKLKQKTQNKFVFKYEI